MAVDADGGHQVLLVGVELVPGALLGADPFGGLVGEGHAGAVVGVGLVPAVVPGGAPGWVPPRVEGGELRVVGPGPAGAFHVGVGGSALFVQPPSQGEAVVFGAVVG